MMRLLIVLGLAIGAGPMPAQAIFFQQQFGNSPLDVAYGIGVDASGVYVAGYSSGSGGSVTLRKCDTGGNELWTQPFGVSGHNVAIGAALTATGVYVAGYSSGNPTLRKYDAGGNELWTRPLSPSRSSLGPVVAADANGVYVAATSDTDEVFVSKYGASGAELWTRRFGKTGLVTGVASDGAEIYVAGGLCCDGGAFVRKYDTTGNELWTRQFGHLSIEVPGAVTVDATGLYVAGTTRRALPGQCYGGGADIFVRKYDARGNELWTRQFGTWADEVAWGAAVDATGVYVIGRQDGYQQESKTFLAKLEKTPAVITDSKPRILHECVLNAASYIGGGVAPGEIVTILGSRIGPPELTPMQVTEEGRLETTLAGTRVLFNGVPAPLVDVSEQRSSAIVPFG